MAENHRLEAECSKVQAELRSLREEFAALKEALTNQTNTEKRRKMVARSDPPVESQPPRVEPKAGDMQIAEIVTKTMEAHLNQATEHITRQLSTLAERVDSVCKELGALHKRIEVVEKTQSRRREKPYDRPTTQDPHEGNANGQ